MRTDVSGTISTGIKADAGAHGGLGNIVSKAPGRIGDTADKAAGLADKVGLETKAGLSANLGGTVAGSIRRNSSDVESFTATGSGVSDLIAEKADHIAQEVNSYAGSGAPPQQVESYSTQLLWEATVVA